MIKLYREQVSPQADAIEAEFRELILGYDREILTSADSSQRFDAVHLLPIITNNQRIVSGASIPAYLKELQDLMRDWQAFQGDSCYVNENGETCFK